MTTQDEVLAFLKENGESTAAEVTKGVTSLEDSSAAAKALHKLFSKGLINKRRDNAKNFYSFKADKVEKTPKITVKVERKASVQPIGVIKAQSVVEKSELLELQKRNEQLSETLQDERSKIVYLSKRVEELSALLEKTKQKQAKTPHCYLVGSSRSKTLPDAIEDAAIVMKRSELNSLDVFECYKVGTVTLNTEYTPK